MYILVFSEDYMLFPKIEEEVKKSLPLTNIILNSCSELENLYTALENNVVDCLIIDSKIGFDDTSMMVKYSRGTNPFSYVIILGIEGIQNFHGNLTVLFKQGIQDYLPAPWNVEGLVKAIPHTRNQNKIDLTNMFFIDDLSGLFNTRFLHFKLEKELRKATSEGKRFSILFLDVDNFKLVNERYGHIVASSILQLTGRFIKENLRDDDLAFRYGGDEFLVLLSNVTGDQAFNVAERLRRTIEAKRFLVKATYTINITVSIGVASFPEDGKNKIEILEMADKAMFMGKRTTKNVVFSAKNLVEVEDKPK
jgi:diguanylate cyclase (GGDEF)-like protein